MTSTQAKRVRLSILVLTIACSWLTEPQALAQASRLGSAFPMPPLPVAGSKRWPDVAFDRTNNLYLVVFGNEIIQGQFVSSDGTLLGGPFKVNASAGYAQAPRVAHSADSNSFLVTWHETVGRLTAVRGRLVRYNATPLTGDFDISVSGDGTNWEMGAGVAYSTGSQEFLVTWQAPFPAENPHIRGRRISSAGSMIGGEFQIDRDNFYHRDPGVAYNPVTNQFFIAYGAHNGSYSYVEAQLIQAGTGSRVGGSITLAPSALSAYVPEVAFNSATGKFVVVWYHRSSGGAAIYGRTVNGDGTPDGDVRVVSTRHSAYDANSIAYNPVSNTFVVVTHSQTNEDAGIELTATGAPVDNGFLATGGSAKGNFNPRVASHLTRAEWLMATSYGFSVPFGQRIQSATRDATGGVSAAPPAAPAPAPPPPPAATYTLTVSRSGAGLVAATNGISCGTACSGTFNAGTQVTLTATPTAGYVFAGWLGDAECANGVVTMHANRSCTAKFNKALGVANRRVVDLTGQGAGDVFLYAKTGGEWYMAHNDTGGDFAYNRGRWSDDGWSMRFGSFNNDALGDILLYSAQSGRWFLGLNNGRGAFTFTNGILGPGFEVRLGRFNLDRIDDLLAYSSSNGVAFQFWSDGTGGFTRSIQMQWAAGYTSLSLGRFDRADGDDVFAYNTNSGAWAKLINDGNGSFAATTGSWSPGWRIHVADLDGNGVDDLWIYNPENGVWYRCINTLAGWDFTPGRWDGGWETVVGTFNSDGRDDLFIYHPRSGVWFLCLSNGSNGFDFVSGNWSPGFEIHLTELNGDALNDLFVFNQESGVWFKCFSNGSGGFSFARGVWSGGWTVVTKR